MRKVKVYHVDKKYGKDPAHAEYSDKQKYNAVALYKLTGNMAAVSRTMGIPLDTLYDWKKAKWWPQFEADLLQEKRALTGSSLEKLAKKAAEIIEDRLTHGDWIYVNGELRRKPVNVLVANKVLQESLKQERELEEHYAKQTKAESDIQINDRLKLLFEEMTRFANSKEIRVSKSDEEIRVAKGGDPNLPALAGAVEGEQTNAVHDQRETGLQEGTGVGEEDHRQGAAESTGPA